VFLCPEDHTPPSRVILTETFSVGARDCGVFLRLVLLFLRAFRLSPGIGLTVLNGFFVLAHLPQYFFPQGHTPFHLRTPFPQQLALDGSNASSLSVT